jgi:hypothetical protein
MKSEQHNLGADLATVRQLLDRAAAAAYVGPGEVAMVSIAEILDRWLALDKQTPLRFTTETQELVDTEHGTVTGSQSRWVGDWWVDVPEAAR